MSLTSIRLLEPHLTAENCRAVLAKAANRTRRQIDALVAELAPRPDLPASVRRVAMPRPTPPAPSMEQQAVTTPAPRSDSQAVETDPGAGPSAAAVLSAPRPIVRASAPQRYRVQFTINEDTHDDLRRVQALLCREIPDGDPGLIFARALRSLLEKVEKDKLGATARPRSRRPTRPGTGRNVTEASLPSRHVPAAVKRAVWRRDGKQCAFVSPTGRRCTERSFLEFHHVQPYAMEGPATVGNISLRCWRHNHYEGERIFGPHRGSTAGKGREALVFDLPER